MSEASSHARPRVATIGPQCAFLDTLIGALFAGKIIPDYVVDRVALADDPFLITDLTLYLPTRRAVRAAEDAFFRAISSVMGTDGRNAALLPTIRAIGDTDEADLLFQQGNDDPLAAIAALPPALPELERHVILTQLVWSWSKALIKKVAPMEPYEAVIIPANPADAAYLAGNLASLLDEAENQGVDWRELETLVPDDFAVYWQLSLDFLKIVTDAWPQHLMQSGMIDGMARRNLLIRAKAKALSELGASAGPTIAAGSTGSVPATAELLKTIAELPQGAIVLPGLDLTLDDEAWASIGTQQMAVDGDPAALGHPQAALKQTLNHLRINRDNVVDLKPEIIRCSDRFRLINEALRPVEATHGWPEFLGSFNSKKITASLQDVSLIEARGPQEEALSIALALREALETGRETTTALITPDRNLARRVSVELMRFGIRADDSAGQPLFATPAGTLSRLLIETAQNQAEAVDLLGLIKHPLAGFGEGRAHVRRASRVLERAILRGPAIKPGSAAIIEALEHRIIQLKSGGKDAPRLSASQRGLQEDDWQTALEFATKISGILQPLELLLCEPELRLGDVVAVHLQVLQSVIEGPDTAPLFAGSQDGLALVTALSELLAAHENDYSLTIQPADYANLVQALIGNRPVRRNAHADDDRRIQILGTLEARLIDCDRVVLAGLNEKTWPGETQLDPWLSRAMRARLGLSPPEHGVGLSAHDFVQLACAPKVILTRSLRHDGAPTQASRWLQRLEALAGPKAKKAMSNRGDYYLGIARHLDAPDQPHGNLAKRPAPTPQLELRPRKLSVTEIETLIRDPYAIYARHILKLSPYDEIGKTPSFAERGSLVHDILHRFVDQRSDNFDSPQAAQELSDLADEFFEPLQDFPELYASWRSRFDRISRWFLANEAAWNDQISKRFTERYGTLKIDLPPFQLSGRADRFDLHHDGSATILDYKTGSPPSKAQVETHYAPQLPLEAAMLAAGVFENVPPLKANKLSYIQLSGNREPGKLHHRASGIDEIGNLGAAALDKLKALIAHYDQFDTGYLSQAQREKLRYEGDYDHLARVAEWRGLDGDE